jgi:beta-lactamase class C
LLEQRLFPALGLRHTFIRVPKRELPDYAWGYTDDGKRIRMVADMLSDETGGVRTTAADLSHFIRENIDHSALPQSLGRAIEQTHVGYYRAGSMTQDLIWEQYPYPVALPSLLAGNADSMIFEPYPVLALQPPSAPSKEVWLNKTGSTNGFATYVAFVPAKHLGIVLLANKAYPIEDRVTAGFRILHAIAAGVFPYEVRR